MKRSGSLSPWITPRTMRPCCSTVMSIGAVVPGRALPTRQHRPRGARLATAWASALDAAARDRTDARHRILVRGVHDMGRAELARQIEAVVAHVDRDDRAAAG